MLKPRIFLTKIPLNCNFVVAMVTVAGCMSPQCRTSSVYLFFCSVFQIQFCNDSACLLYTHCEIFPIRISIRDFVVIVNE